MPCLWITGLSGAGKSTVGQIVASDLRVRGSSTVYLDGDVLREVFGAAAVGGTHHGREARIDLAFKYAHLCRVLSEQGVTVVIATISLFERVHQWNRAHIPGYFEVFLDVPFTELRRRDPKGIYRGFEAGSVKDVAGLDLEVDFPSSPDLTLAFDSRLTPTDLAQTILDAFGEVRDYED